MTMYLDRKLAAKLLREEKKKEGKNLVRACLILRGDESWNTEEIYPKKQKDFLCYGQSYWATPMLRFEYADGKERLVECYRLKEPKD